MAEASAIWQQIRATQAAMVDELRAAVKNPSYGVKKPALVMFNREDSVEGYWRYLCDANWDLEEALRLMGAAEEWHVSKGTKLDQIKAAAYKAKPGLFSLRQVGFDPEGRPVLYCCFAQNSAALADWTADACIAHLVHIAENAGRTCKLSSEEGGYQNHIIIDCTGFTAVPFQKAEFLIKLQQTLSLLYPEVIKGVIVINYTQEVRNVWSGIKEHMDDSLQSKVKFVPPATVTETMRSLFGKELFEWLQCEIKLNKTSPLPVEQREFYKEHAGHDPRGTPAYVSAYLLPTHPDGHRPHPGISL